MIPQAFYSIFKNGSKTYFYSSLFFPADVKLDVFTLYSFVRTIDNFVDQKPQKKLEFYSFRKKYEAALKGITSHNQIIDAYVLLAKKRQFDPEWTASFFRAMESDLANKRYATLADSTKYMYGSAEVIGLMMARILQLPRESWPHAQQLGRAMQYVNFIRDIAEDLELGRNYFPQTEMKKFGLETLKLSEVERKPDSFHKFIAGQVSHYLQWQQIGEAGFKYIPKRYLIPIKTASDLYSWSAKAIIQDPMIVYRKKMKPPLLVIAAMLIKNLLRPT